MADDSRDNPIHPVPFPGEITTLADLKRAYAHLLREYAAGRVAHQQYSALLSGLRFIGDLFRRYPHLAETHKKPPKEDVVWPKGFDDHTAKVPPKDQLN